MAASKTRISTYPAKQKSKANSLTPQLWHQEVRAGHLW